MMERDPELGGVFSDAEFIDESQRSLGARLWASSLTLRLAKQRGFQTGEGTSVC